MEMADELNLNAKLISSDIEINIDNEIDEYRKHELEKDKIIEEELSSESEDEKIIYNKSKPLPMRFFFEGDIEWNINTQYIEFFSKGKENKYKFVLSPNKSIDKDFWNKYMQKKFHLLKTHEIECACTIEFVNMFEEIEIIVDIIGIGLESFDVVLVELKLLDAHL
jgi:NAD+--asparagine ADP-ribosyltransferase